MADKRKIDELSEQLSKLIPQARAAGEDVRKTLSSGLQKGLSRMDLLTREEFDQQARALVRAQERIDALEQTVRELEQRIAAQDDPDSHQTDDNPAPRTDD